MRTLWMLVVLTLGTAAQAADEKVIKLWPTDLPEPKVQTAEPETIIPVAPGAPLIQRATNISQPVLVVYEPEPAKKSGTGIIVVPGGGFRYLTVDLEGSEVCEWLRGLGITAFLLKHRAPTDKHEEPNAGPVQDLQRSLSLIRSQAAELGLKADRIGVLGFSAGGQIAAVATGSELRFKQPDATVASHRPDFVLLLYPYGIYRPDTKSLRADIKVDGTSPPTFIAQAGDDRASLPQGSTLLYLALLEAKVPAELHIYETGGHGFGLRPGKVACPTDWPKRAEIWLKARGL